MLSYPSIFMRLGMVGGVLATLAFSSFAYICAWIIVDFKCRHMGVMNYADAAMLVGGPIAKWVVGIMLVVKSMFLAGSHAVVGAEAFSVMTNHKICNVWWALVVTVISMIVSQAIQHQRANSECQLRVPTQEYQLKSATSECHISLNRS